MKNSSKKILLTYAKKELKRAMYAVYYGAYQGASLCYIEEDSIGDTLAFLVMSPTEPIYISKKEFRNALKKKNIELIDQLPQDVYEVVSANYFYYKEKTQL